jgi:hypothetical protein
MTNKPHKWLPSEPTDEMLRSTDSFMSPVAKVLYERMWEAATSDGQENTNIYYTDAIWNNNDNGIVSITSQLHTTHNPKPSEKMISFLDREPLSEDSLITIWDSTTKETAYDQFRTIFRIAEKAHGIGI